MNALTYGVAGAWSDYKRKRVVSIFKDIEGVEFLRCKRDDEGLEHGYEQRSYTWLTEASEKRLYRVLNAYCTLPEQMSPFNSRLYFMVNRYQT